MWIYIVVVAYIHVFLYPYQGLMRGRRFVRYTNFDVEVLFSATTPKDVSPTLSGCIFLIRTTDGTER